jgi:hypothetical protein
MSIIPSESYILLYTALDTLIDVCRIFQIIFTLKNIEQKAEGFYYI